MGTLRIIVVCSCAVSATPAGALEYLVLQRGQQQKHVAGQILVEAEDGGLLLKMATGAMLAIQPDEIQNRTSDDKPLQLYDRNEMIRRRAGRVAGRVSSIPNRQLSDLLQHDQIVRPMVWGTLRTTLPRILQLLVATRRQAPGSRPAAGGLDLCRQVDPIRNILAVISQTPPAVWSVTTASNPTGSRPTI